MSNTGTPVYRPTADCIWNSFRSSGKRHLLLTGQRNVGKTRLLSELFPEILPGITTWVEPQKAVFLQDNSTKITAQIGKYESSRPGDRNKMVLWGRGFEDLGLAALRRCMASESEWVSIDEIGYLETEHPKYLELILKLMDCKRVAAVVRKQNIPFLQDLCSRSDVFLVDLDDPFGDSGCVIMASGIGKRFGGNKLMADFCGKPMINGILSATQGIFSRRVVVTRHEDVAALCKEKGIQVVVHDLPGRNDTVRLGLERVGGADRCVFCAADQPLLCRETLSALALAALNEPEYIWGVEFENRFSTPVLFPKWAFPELMNLPEGVGGNAVIKKYPERLRCVSARDRYELMDVDTPEELALLAER